MTSLSKAPVQLQKWKQLVVTNALAYLDTASIISLKSLLLPYPDICCYTWSGVPQVAPFRKALVLLADNRLGWKWLAVTNTLAY